MSYNSGWVKQGHTPCKMPLLQPSFFLCQSNFVEIIRLSQDEIKSGHPQFWGYYQVYNCGICQWVCFMLGDSGRNKTQSDRIYYEYSI